MKHRHLDQTHQCARDKGWFKTTVKQMIRWLLWQQVLKINIHSKKKWSKEKSKAAETRSCTACKTGAIIVTKYVSKYRLLGFTESAAVLSDRFR